ncbi:2-dehydropantoate 2-reductase [Roseiterribacter gracilis]|uniref:2-dehydropantoate 2-reductase n=1 Tax=Roseiterribacter gracilis TaxID=2812848 RepID=A0A8S8X9P7_9PROT|nr:2-dehydropantoate 2-reductase [Rhodospirillales bacterium TMPK1]
MRIAVIGPGAIGGTVAAWLAQRADLDVTICARSPLPSLTIETPSRTITATPRVLTDPGQGEPVDWVLIATKAYDAEGASRWLTKLVDDTTRVAVLQNGVEHIERFTPYLPAARITPAIVDIPAERNAPGRIHQRRDGSILVPNDAASFVDLFAHTPIAVSTTDDFRSEAWRKLCINAAGAVSALTMKPAGIVARDDVAAIMWMLVEECAAVGRAEGAVLDDKIEDEIIARYRAGPPDGINSMLGDRLANRPMEIDARNGVIVRLGKKHGIPTPMNAMIVTLLETAAA